MVNSTTDWVEARGALTTGMPALAAATMSMLSTPTPARPITERRSPEAAITSAGSFVALRTTMASNSERAP